MLLLERGSNEAGANERSLLDSASIANPRARDHRPTPTAAVYEARHLGNVINSSHTRARPRSNHEPQVQPAVSERRQIKSESAVRKTMN